MNKKEETGRGGPGSRRDAKESEADLEEAKDYGADGKLSDVMGPCSALVRSGQALRDLSLHPALSVADQSDIQPACSFCEFASGSPLEESFTGSGTLPLVPI